MPVKQAAFRYFSGVPTYDTATVFFARVDKSISTAEEFLRSLYYLLWFPGYFGFNWDALSDCLRDLSWMPCRQVVLVHDGLPRLPDKDLRTYLEILRDAVNDWGEGEDHSLEVVFQVSDRARIENLLGS